jgi:hypothetical protein
MMNMRTHDAGDLVIHFDVEFPSERSLTDPEVLKVSLKSYFLMINNLFYSNLNRFYQNDHMLIFQKVNMWKKHI